MRVHVAFTPSEAATADLGIVVDVIRATSSIAQALASGYRRVLCCAEVEQARALRGPRGETLVLSTTNGTRGILAGGERCDQVVLGPLLNLDAMARGARG